MNIIQRIAISCDRTVTVANLVDELMRRNGDREISIENDRPFSLAELHAEVRAIDAFLRRTVGLLPGQPVAIYRSNDRCCFHWFLAIIRAGGIAVPLNPMLTLAEVRHIMTSSGTDILVTDRAVFERNIGDRKLLNVRIWIQADQEAETLNGFMSGLDINIKTSELFPPVPLDPGATVAVFHTSGTSGFPKEQRFLVGLC